SSDVCSSDLPEPSMSESSNQAFLVSGSLSSGLLAATKDDFFSGGGDEPAVSAPKKKKSKSAAPGMSSSGGGSGGGGGGKKGTKRAKKASKGKKRGNDVISFGKKKNERQFHGTVFTSFRNSEADARQYSMDGEDARKASYAYSRFGFAAGGPLSFIKRENTFLFV